MHAPLALATSSVSIKRSSGNNVGLQHPFCPFNMGGRGGRLALDVVLSTVEVIVRLDP